MAEVTLERVTEQARALTTQEQQQLRALLDSWLTPPVDDDLEARERQFLKDMVAKGVFSHIPRRYQEGYVPEEFERHPPIIVHGEPVSETIIRERR